VKLVLPVSTVCAQMKTLEFRARSTVWYVGPLAVVPHAATRRSFALNAAGNFGYAMHVCGFPLRGIPDYSSVESLL